MGVAELHVVFGDGGNEAAFLGEGWSGAEPFGRWMLDAASTLQLPAPPGLDHLTLTFQAMPFLGGGRLAAQPLRVLVDGHPVFAAEIAADGEFACTVPAALQPQGGQVTVTLLHDGARAPAELGLGGDGRRLSLALRTLTLRGVQGAGVPARPTSGLPPPVLEVHPLGNLGNRMIQYMVARRIQAAVPGCVLSGVSLDEWGLSTDRHAGDWTDLTLADEQAVDIDAAAELLRARRVRKIAYRGYGQRLRNFPPPQTCREMFLSPVEVDGFGDRDLVVSVRAGDVLQAVHRDYVLTPPAYLRALVDETGLRPVLLGQLDDTPYTALLRASLPEARLVASRGAMVDFETLRRSRNIVVAVSTFSWLAAWLSDARRIFLPVNGLFNPLQYPQVDLLPLQDPRYRFDLFPVNYAVPMADLARQFGRLADTWRRVSPRLLAALLDEARSLHP